MPSSPTSKGGQNLLTGRADSIASRQPDRTGARSSSPPNRALPDRVHAKLITNRADGNLLDCQILDGSGNEIGAVVAARNHDLRKDFWSTVGSASYTFVDKDTRTVSGETQKVTPDYVEDESILVLERFPWGTGLTDPNTNRRVVWQDNTPGRSWAKDDS